MFVHHGAFGGGAPFSMLYTAQVARDLGYDPRVLLLHPSDDLRSLYGDAGFDVDELNGLTQWYYYAAAPMPWTRPSAYKQLLTVWRGWSKTKQLFTEYLRQHPAEVVQLNSVVLIILAQAMRDSGQRFIWHIREHGPPIDDWRARIFRRELYAAPEVIFLSPAEQRSWLKSNDHGTIVHNFVPEDRFQCSLDGRSVRTQLSIEPDEFAILFVGGIRPHKGGHQFLKALQIVQKRLAESGKKFVAVLPGALPDEEQKASEVRSVVAKYGLSDCCRLFPFLTNIDDYIAACDVLAFPSQMPHFARPIVEAAAMSTPVIASDIPPMNDFLIDGENAYLTSCGDHNELAARLIDAIQNPQAMARMGARLHRDFRERFSVSTQSAKLQSIYERLMGPGASLSSRETFST